MNLIEEYKSRFCLQDGYFYAKCIHGGSDNYWTTGLDGEILIIFKDSACKGIPYRYSFFKEESSTRRLDVFTNEEEEEYKNCGQKILILPERSMGKKPHGWNKYLKHIGDNK